MPNKHAAIKDLRKSKKRAKKNLRLKIHSRATFQQFLKLIKEGKVSEAKDLAPKVQQILDKTAKARIFNKNKSAHKISTMHKLIGKK